jgi:hypothetical protein
MKQLICSDCEKPKYKKDLKECFGCKRKFCLKHIYQYVDKSNRSITKNSKIYCKKCYNKKYEENFLDKN